MRAVGVKLLKNRLSEYLRLAASGETILVTDRDRVVAELKAPSEGRSGVLSDAFLAEGVRQGWLSQPLIATGDAPPSLPRMSLAKLLRGLARDRDDR